MENSLFKVYRKQKNRFNKMNREVIINMNTVEEELEEDKRKAIKSIMVLVDSFTNGETHKNIRKAVLDSINQLSRNHYIMIEKIISKYSGDDEIGD